MSTSVAASRPWLARYGAGIPAELPRPALSAIDQFRAGAIQFGAFRLKLHEDRPDAPLSPLYINLRLLRSYPDQMDVAVDVVPEAGMAVS